MFWDDLMRNLPRYEEWSNGTTQQRMRIARENLRDNPHICAYWFHFRYETFKRTVLYKKFDIVDEWNRHEWQGRGSTHNHGVYWLRNAPSPEVDSASENERQQFAMWWDVYISAWNPDPQRGARSLDEISAMSLPLERQENNVRHLSGIVSRVQKHHCSTTYCLRKNKVTGQVSCRFHFPWRLQNEPTLEKPPTSNFHRLFCRRNDSHLNPYNRLVSMAWLANTDISPCTGSKAVLEYLAKYVSKPEKQTESYEELMKRLLPSINTNRPVLSAVTKLMNQLIAERDWSAQEVCHILLDLPLQHGSRQVLNVDVRPEDQQDQRFVFGDSGDGEERPVRQGKSCLQKYKERPENLENLSYLEFLLKYDFSNPRNIHKRSRAPDRVLRYLPEYKPDQEEDFGRVKMMLHYPFRQIDDLKRVGAAAEPWETFKEAYAYCKASHDDHDPDLYFIEVEEPEDPFEEPGEGDDDGEQEPWMDMAAQLPTRDGTRLEDPDGMGDRDLDRGHDWESHRAERYPVFSDDFWQVMQVEHPETTDRVHSSATVEGLEFKQRQLYELIIGHYRNVLRKEPVEQLLINLDGKGGTGKSHVIKLISAHSDEMAANAGVSQCPVVRAAPTGVAAVGINGRTLHSLFRFPVPLPSTYAKLTTQNLQALQAKFEGVRYLIIDEKSMIGLQQLAWIDQRCREIFPHGHEEPFGGLTVVIGGDFFQLPPVRQKPLFYGGELQNPMEIAGRQLYHRFNTTIELDVIRRQVGMDSTAQRFRDALNHLREDKVTYDDWKLLSSRVSAVVPDEIESFKDAVRIYPKKDDVREYNRSKLRDLRRPVARINALHEGRGADKASSEEAGNLSATLLLSIGARIMLLENIWTERGLVNGAFGVVHDIVWRAEDDPRRDPPFAVLIKFDNYSGPSLTTTEDNDIIVPIFKSKREFVRGNTPCTRIQFPITLAYAITVHKAQGISVKRAVLNIANRDFTPGLTYVAVSRVETLGGVLFEEPFDYFERFKPRVSKTTEWREQDASRRRKEHV